MAHISETERQAIRKEELKDFKQKELRASGYYLRHDRDRGWGAMQDITGKEVVLEWHIEEELREEGKAYSNVPKTHFIINAGGQQLILDKETFRKIYRWV